MSRRHIKQLVESILGMYQIKTAPIDVEKLAELIGAEIRRGEFDHDLSGFAFQKLGAKYIGVNSKDGEQRQRFTIAHELGHIFLHKHNPVNYDQGIIMLRDSHSSEGNDRREIEANRFAAELLMPEDLIRQDISKLGGIELFMDDTENKTTIKLAQKYNVSISAMNFRLTALYLN